MPNASLYCFCSRQDRTSYLVQRSCFKLIRISVPQRQSSEHVLNLPIGYRELAIHEQISYASRKHFGFCEGSEISNCVRIEDDKIREVALLQKPSLLESEGLRRQGRTRADGERQRDHVLVEDVSAQLSRECPVFARVSSGAV